jgi:hypothetical protein
VLRNLEQINQAQEPRFARQCWSEIWKTDLVEIMDFPLERIRKISKRARYKIQERINRDQTDWFLGCLVRRLCVDAMYSRTSLRAVDAMAD